MKFKLNIDKPCNEDFNSFSKTDKGGFCASCEKEVIDFSTWTEGEIISYFKNYNQSNTCGRLRKGQLKIYGGNVSPVQRFRYYLAGAISAFMLMASSKALSQDLPKRHNIYQVDTTNDAREDVEGPTSISGVVVSSDVLEPAVGINVLQKGTPNGTVTDLEGKFYLELIKSENPVIIFSFIGYRTLEVPLRSQSYDSLTVELMPDVHQLGEVVMTGGISFSRWYTPRGILDRTKSLWWRLKGWFRKE